MSDKKILQFKPRPSEPEQEYMSVCDCGSSVFQLVFKRSTDRLEIRCLECDAEHVIQSVTPDEVSP